MEGLVSKWRAFTKQVSIWIVHTTAMPVLVRYLVESPARHDCICMRLLNCISSQGLPEVKTSLHPRFYPVFAQLFSHVIIINDYKSHLCLCLNVIRGKQECCCLAMTAFSILEHKRSIKYISCARVLYLK